MQLDTTAMIDSLKECCNIYQDSIDKLNHLLLESKNMSIPVDNWWKYILLAGFFGAVAGYVYKLSIDNPAWQPIEALKSLVLGIAAAFMGPVILYLLRSDILTKIKDSQEGAYYLIGITILVSMFGQYFIEKLKGIFDKLKEQEQRINTLIRVSNLDKNK